MPSSLSTVFRQNCHENLPSFQSIIPSVLLVETTEKSDLTWVYAVSCRASFIPSTLKTLKIHVCNCFSWNVTIPTPFWQLFRVPAVAIVSESCP